MTWKPAYGLLILGLTVVNYFLGLAISRSTRRRKLWLIGSIVFNLLVLGFFKYAYFALDLVNQALSPFGQQMPGLAFQIILPLGISFFAFEFIHYISDVYKGDKPVRNFFQFALFPSFFPTQIAGPIKRYQDFVPQLNEEKRLTVKDFDEGFKLILFGLAKKVIFADNLGIVVDSAFKHPELLSGGDLWLASYAFAFQVYFDFSGYTDVARGSAQLLGFKVPINFNLPYLAGSITDFWRRWHISLSTWLRDYVYFPLGGSRLGKLLTYRNLLITMVVCGLWHGAAVHYVAYGAIQGVLLYIHREFTRFSQALPAVRQFLDSRPGHVLCIFVTFHTVVSSYVFFRAESCTQAVYMLSKMCSLAPSTQQSSPFALTLPSITDPIMFMLLPVVLIGLMAAQVMSGILTTRRFHLPAWLNVAYMASLALLLLVFAPDSSPKFIYFQF